MAKLFLIIVFAPVLSICSLFYLQERQVYILHEQINHTTLEVLAMLSRHRATDLPIGEYWDWKGRINHRLTDDRRGYEVSRSTDIYLVERDGGGNCTLRSKPRFNGYYERDHMFIPCSRAVSRTLQTGGFRGISTNYNRASVLSVGRTVKARGFDESFTDLVLLVEISRSEVIELTERQEKAVFVLALILTGIIILSALMACLFLYLSNKKRAKAENERDKALQKLRIAVAVSTDVDYDI